MGPLAIGGMAVVREMHLSGDQLVTSVNLYMVSSLASVVVGYVVVVAVVAHVAGAYVVDVAYVVVVAYAYVVVVAYVAVASVRHSPGHLAPESPELSSWRGYNPWEYLDPERLRTPGVYVFRVQLHS